MVKVNVSLCSAFRAVILGAPASGKGTISSRMVKAFGVTHISAGDRLRDHVARGTDIGKKIKPYMETGQYVPNEIVISLMRHELGAAKDKNVLLDGFPRTTVQAQELQEFYPMSHVINIIVPDSVIIERVKTRWIHLPSGRVYNIGFNDPKVPGKDDITGEALSQRVDDKPEIVAKRLKDYSEKTQPVINYYRELGIVQDFKGNTTDEMWPQIKSFISSIIDEKS